MNRLLMLKVFYSALLLMPSGANVVRSKKLKIRKSLIFNFLRIVLGDPVGIQTQDLQNRNLTLYSAKLRDQCLRKADAKVQKTLNIEH